MSCKLIVILSSLVVVTGCTLTPTGEFERLARTAGFESTTVVTHGGELRAFVRPSDRAADLHVYLTGDGTPWRTARTASRDPTPRTPVVIDLAAADPARTVILGRPCYHRTPPACDPVRYTFDRYSEDTVESLVDAVGELIRGYAPERTVVIGYSGGGVLALLLGQRLAEVERVITIAANLDIDAWTEHLGYRALGGSLNPADSSNWRADLVHVHFTGSKDQVVPPEVQSGLYGVPGGAFATVEGFDHRCCWSEFWPALLALALERPVEPVPALVSPSGLR